MRSKYLKQSTAFLMAMILVATTLNFDFSVYGEISHKENVKVETKKENVQDTKETKEPTIVKELEDLRTASSSTYLLSNGSRRLELYGADIRYEKNGKFLDYDPTLVKVSDRQKKVIQKSKMVGQEAAKEYIYTNASGDSKQYFPESLSENTGVILEKGDYAIDFMPVVRAESTLSLESKKKNQIIYATDEADIAYKYTSNTDGVKEEIILNSVPEVNIFEYYVNLPGMKLVTARDKKSIQIVDKKTGETIAYIAEPDIKDRDGQVKYDEVEYAVKEEQDESYILQVIVDESYLKAESTKYPITIDPTVLWMSTNLQSASVCNMPYTTTINMKDDEMAQVQNRCNTYGPYAGTEKYCYIDTSGISTKEAFAGEAENLESKYIQKASLRLLEYKTNGVPTPNGSIVFRPGTVEVRGIEDTWNPNTITWNNHPAMGDKVWAQFQCTGKKMTEHNVDITEWARAVVNKKIANHGLALRAKEEGTGDTFYSSQINYDDEVNENGLHMTTYMMLVIEYRDVERYYGAPGVYSSTGNYSETSDDMIVQTVLGDISLSRTYNSLQYNQSSIVGNGFTLNHAMRVIHNSSRAMVVMPNSSQWKFYKSGTEYTPKGNTGKLTFENNKFKLTTIDMTEYGFDENDFLEYIKDSDGNILNIATDSSGKILSITDVSGTNILFTYSGEHVVKIEELKDNIVLKQVEYVYSEDYLMKVKYPGGLERHYEYTAGRLSKVTDSGEDNADAMKTIGITYYTGGTYEGMVHTLTDSIDTKSTYTYNFEEKSTVINDSTTDNTSIRYMKETYNDNLAVIKVEDLKNSSENQQIQEIEYEEQENVDPDNPSSNTDEYGNITKYEYDEEGNLTKTIYPDGSTEISVYDQNNNLIHFTDRNGLVTENTYNADGLLTKTTCGGITTASYEYYPEKTYGIAGLIRSEYDGHSNHITYKYDNKGNVLESTEYGISGNLVQTHTTKNTYDSQGRVIKTIDPNGIVTEYIYNEAGSVLLTKVQDKNGKNIQITRTVHDVLGRVIQEINALDYDSTKDNLEADYYTDKNVGSRTKYDDKGQVISETDRLGNTTSYIYDSDGNVSQETQPNGSYKTNLYDRDGRKIKEVFYDNITKKTILSQVISYTEGKNEVITKDYMSDVMVATTKEEYDWEGNVIQKTEPNGAVSTNTYTNGLLTREEHALGTWTEYVYDTWGRVTKQTSSFDADGDSITKYTYDNYGNVLTESVKNSTARQSESYSKKEYAYDLQDNLVKTVYYEGNTPVRCTQSFYSWDGKLLREFKGMEKPLIINGPDYIENPDEQEYSIIKYEYDDMGRLKKKTDALGNTETYQYDKENRQIYRKDKNGVEHTIVYDRNGNPLKEMSGDITKIYTYDCMGNVTSEAEGSLKTTFTYDGKGNCLSETTGNIEKTYSYNNADMVTGHTISIGGMQKQNTTKSYDNMGNVTSIYENGTLKASYTYDLLGQLTKTTNSNGTSENNTYNLAGLVTSTVNKKDTTVLSKYVYTYYYDGKECTKTDSESIRTYVYDGAGQLIKEVEKAAASDNVSLEKASLIQAHTPVEVNIETIGQIRYYSFISAVTGNYVISSSNNSGDPVGYLYSSDGTLITSNDDNGGNNNFKIQTTLTAGTRYVIAVKGHSGKVNCTLLIQQNQNGENTKRENARMITTDVPVCAKIDHSYQMRYYGFTPEVTGIYTFLATEYSNESVISLYSSDGTYILNNQDRNKYPAYKLEYELTAGKSYIIGTTLLSSGTLKLSVIPPEMDDRTVTEYSYDASGNRIKQKENKSSETIYTYDENDRLLTEKKGTQEAVAYTYDANGNVTGKSDGTVQAFDDRNRMISYKSEDGTTIIYSYYPDDMRKSKKEGTSTEITHVWLDDEIALDLNGDEVVSSYIHGEKLICASYGWYLYNAHGDVIALTDESGNIKRSYAYNAFGVQSGSNEDDQNPYRYCGEYYDVESGYTYLKARYYDADIGRFISEDPALDGDNWYAYCGNDPVNMIDPTGMWGENNHKKITEKAVNGMGRLYSIFFPTAGLYDGCVYPDIAYSKPPRHEWHGHGGYDEIMVKQIYKAKKAFRKGKVYNAAFELGKGLHTIQDFYAHNIMLNGEKKSSRKAADGTFRVIKGKITLENKKLNKYFPKSFIKSINKSKAITNGIGVHARTADNPHAYFSGGVWKWTAGESGRYKKAIKESKLYLQRAVKCYADDSKLKLGKNFQKNKKKIRGSKYYKKLKL